MRRPLLACAVLVFAPFLVACGGGGIGGIVDAFDRGGDGSGGNDPDGAGVGSMSASEQADADEVLALVNLERARQGLPPVTRDADAEEAAYAHAVDMDVRDFFAHDAPSPNASTPGQRLAAAGATYQGWGENIAIGYTSPASVMAGWMASTGHRNNIMNPSFNRLGVGVRYGTGQALWVQDFLVK
jgi:uncharacterized protein YkwD